MSERGVFALDRGWFDHPAFAPEPFTEREAWAWLISVAAWRSKSVRIGSQVLSVKRGQAAGSVRFLAERWQWSKSRVHRFLERIENQDMIETESGTGITVVTIRNYDKYQKVSLPERDTFETESGTPAGHQRDKEEENIKNIEIDDRGGSAREPSIGKLAWKLAEELAVISGFPTPEDWPPTWMGAPARCQTFLNHGWRADLMLATARGVVARKRDGPPTSVTYFEKPFAKAHALQTSPLPIVEISREPEVIHARQSPQGGLVQAGRKLLAELDGGASEWPSGPDDISGASEVRDVEGNGTLRLVSKG